MSTLSPDEFRERDALRAEVLSNQKVVRAACALADVVEVALNFPGEKNFAASLGALKALRSALRKAKVTP